VLGAAFGDFVQFGRLDHDTDERHGDGDGHVSHDGAIGGRALVAQSAECWGLAAYCGRAGARLPALLDHAGLGNQGRRRGWGIALVFTVFALLVVSVGCGGSSGGGTGPPQNPGTPVGNYGGVSVTVTVNGVTQTIPNLTLNVQ
jgi:hypothetical protein